eukprot:6986748-Prymnesium_polylepis.1
MLITWLSSPNHPPQWPPDSRPTVTVHNSQHGKADSKAEPGTAHARAVDVERLALREAGPSREPALELHHH